MSDGKKNQLGLKAPHVQFALKRERNDIDNNNGLPFSPWGSGRVGVSVRGEGSGQGEGSASHL